VLVDADVDAANLGLVLKPDIAERHEFWGGSLAEIDPQRCQGCGACADVCRYDAVIPGIAYAIDPTACDGCAACVYACPEQAIRMVQQLEGEWFRSQTLFGPLFHAELYPGAKTRASWSHWSSSTPNCWPATSTSRWSSSTARPGSAAR
jgi:MinD superfamily P-loop ATPase